MIVGVDVCHEGKTAKTYGTAPKGKYSWVGFCASFDKQYTQYASWMTYQQKGTASVAWL
jgi:hypothetical protein